MDHLCWLSCCSSSPRLRRQVGLWLSWVDPSLSQYQTHFAKHGIDGAALAQLTKEQLQEDLKVRTLGQRLRLLAARRQLWLATDAEGQPTAPLGGGARAWATPAEVGRWLAGQLGFPQYAAAFEAAAVDGEALLQLTEAELRHDLGVHTARWRR